MPTSLRDTRSIQALSKMASTITKADHRRQHQNALDQSATSASLNASDSLIEPEYATGGIDLVT